MKNILCLIMAMALWSGVSLAQDTSSHTTKAADGVYSYGDPTMGYFSMFVVTDDGVIVVEPVNEAHAQATLIAIREVTDKPIRFLLHSHNHWDHSCGGQVFRDAGATIVAHVEAYEWMKANPHPDMVLPDESWGGNRKDIVLGGRTIELHYLGMNHGLGMTVFVLPQEKIAYVADLVTPKRLLFTIVPDFNIGETQRTLREIEQMDIETVLFSHGKPIGTKAEITEIRQYTEDLRSAIHAEFKKGTNPFTIPNVITLPKYEDWAMYDEWLEMNAWRILLDDHMGPFPWRPDHSYE
ncbi:MAG: MBL fold metallo-hydrolase [Candidatus Krumholzibacteriota bacterium]|nr:MBL fold metallo-hydrolase [Candidatus Krumholzibacteriota bacterium]